MTELPIINDITALGLLALVLVLAYYTLNKLFRILVEHLERTIKRQDKMLALLADCLDHRSTIKESFDKNDSIEDIKEPGLKVLNEID